MIKDSYFNGADTAEPKIIVQSGASVSVGDVRFKKTGNNVPVQRL